MTTAGRPGNRCLVCGKMAENHHVKTRGSGGNDDIGNLMSLCRECHTEVHNIGLTTFVQRHHLQANMVRRGFFLCEITNKWRTVRK